MGCQAGQTSGPNQRRTISYFLFEFYFFLHIIKINHVVYLFTYFNSFAVTVSYSLNDASIYKPQKSKERDEKRVSKHHFFNILHVSLTFFSKLKEKNLASILFLLTFL